MSHLVEKVLQITKEHNTNIYIYGAGGLARMIFFSVKKCGGVVDAFVIDDAYYLKAYDELTGLPVKKLSEIIELDFKIIIGFEGDFKEKLAQTGIDEQHILAADFLGYLASSGANGTFETYYFENEKLFAETRDMLEDDTSKIRFDDFVNQKRFGCYSKEYDRNSQYFDEVIIGSRISNKEVFVDCGAFQGETAIAFVDFLKKHDICDYKSIIEIEPDASNIKVMEERLKGYKNIEFVKAGVYDKNGQLSFCSEQGSSSKISDSGDVSIDVISLDEYIKDDVPVSFIKMDIEGSELKALYGAKRTIERNRPKLAICVYHKNEDLIEIPRYIRSWGMDYKFYLRSYSRCGVETVIYAV